MGKNGNGYGMRCNSSSSGTGTGRTSGSDLMVDDGAVSREHAEFTRRKGSIYLVDRSTNGTYVRPQFGKARHLHREEFLLEGSGEFSLGRPDGPAVEYKVS